MDNIGLKKGYLELMDYQEDYPSIYEKEKEELLNIYKERIKQIDHVGSTGIKDIISKPIIDITIQTTMQNESSKLKFIGEYTNLEGCGSMNGAWLSGFECAKKIIEKL